MLQEILDKATNVSYLLDSIANFHVNRNYAFTMFSLLFNTQALHCEDAALALECRMIDDKDIIRQFIEGNSACTLGVDTEIDEGRIYIQTDFFLDHFDLKITDSGEEVKYPINALDIVDSLSGCSVIHLTAAMGNLEKLKFVVENSSMGPEVINVSRKSNMENPDWKSINHLVTNLNYDPYETYIRPRDRTSGEYNERSLYRTAVKKIDSLNADTPAEIVLKDSTASRDLKDYVTDLLFQVEQEKLRHTFEDLSLENLNLPAEVTSVLADQSDLLQRRNLFSSRNR